MSILLSLLSVWLTITPIEYVATGYAPLDPRAVRGVCYSGNPKITASGRLTKPGVSVAAPRHIPFGTWLWVEGVGLRRVDDRGGKIKGRRIDICFATRKEALEWGRRKVLVVKIQ
jgi:3D (Asp-Asp-Asp) domain-containing protein